MSRAKKLIFTVTNDLNYDQRITRISSSLAGAGYQVVVVGRKVADSHALSPRPYRQLRLGCLFQAGPLMYAEFNIRLFFYLMFSKADLICAVDLDTILPCLFVTSIKGIPRAYDAHELFCQMKEVVSRPFVFKTWKAIENIAVPRFRLGYTVSPYIADELNRIHGVQYETIRNLPVREDAIAKPMSDRYIIYQGAVNEGRSFETLLPAMKHISARLVVCGDGNFMNQAKKIARDTRVENKVEFKGMVEPEILKQFTLSAYIGVNIIDNVGLNNRYSLANRFFDYIQCGLPQVCIDFPAYREINDQFGCALLVKDNSVASISSSINTLLNDQTLYSQLQKNCLNARTRLSWECEEEKLLAFYDNIFKS